MAAKELQDNTANKDIKECLDEICEWMGTTQSVLYRIRKDINYLKNKCREKND